jgi:trans-aconitate 2-methyltransferase
VTAWSPGQYLKCEDERTRPARDLLAAVPLTSAATVVDVGCGPGNSTELLVARYGAARIVGVDNSPEMLVAARQRVPSATFEAGDAATWNPPSPVDLIYGNAVFQWVPDHLAVLERLMGHLAPGGVLALQVPDNLAEPSHLLMRTVALDGPWAAKFATPIAREIIPPVAAYYDRLKPFSARIDIWRTTYHHPLADAAAIVEMVRSTGLRPFLQRLDKAEEGAFLAAYRERIAQAYPPTADGRVVLPFPRLFVVAVRV